ncbi:MAG: 3-deoxy-D-manno-octulosonic acid transferase [Rhodobacteraceae bacterium GWE1_64_9]|nr:MAG: 3-deoxy-D-manno-octulosonic acid transferase [Rhodobacteraceae bacterium GWE1_64_9]HBU13694.1 3-deoxy-D-manno-octulosonic acid transferase [Gemmobacter sp.]
MAGLGLKLYALAVRAPDVAAEPPPPRPAGRLVWLHLAPGMQTKGVAELARRIGAEDGHAVLLTGGDAPAALGDAIWQPPPVDRAVAVRAFLDHWRPDAVFLAGGELRPVALTELKRRAVPVAMIECGAPSLPDGRERWFPGLVRAGLDQMHAIHAVDGAAARALLRAGSDAIVTGRMEEPSAALPCNEAERAALAHLLATRPVWLAAGLPEAELPAVLAAHRACLRLAHRLLLIVVPEDPARSDAVAAQIAADEGWITARRSAEEDPDAEVEVYFVDSAEMGLWYRLAPITYLGGTLAGPGALRDPMEAAALGSALMTGPRTGDWAKAVDRLGAARATRPVGTPAELAEALGELLAPDRAARLAQAAWSVSSDGAEATERCLNLMRNMLGES